MSAGDSSEPGAVTFRFGDSKALCERLLGLVREGKKTATCESLRAIENGTEPMPVVGRRDIALNWDGTPALMIETTHIETMRFCDVGPDFALAEGENETLEGWRRDHRAYYERTVGFDPQMIVVCERFRLVEDYSVGD